MYFAICQLTPYEGQVGTRAELREKPPCLIPYKLRENCSPRVRLSNRAPIFGLVGTERYEKLKSKKCANYPPSTIK
jgi:hypothetical protein